MTNPGSDTPAITLSTAITATTTLTHVQDSRHAEDAREHAGAGRVELRGDGARSRAWTGTNAQAGSDTAGTTVTIDNLSPGNVTAATVTAGNAQVTVAWTNPGDADLGSIIVLRRTGSRGDGHADGRRDLHGGQHDRLEHRGVRGDGADGDVHGHGADATATAYYYKVFAKDTNGNYATGATPTGSPVTPNVTTLGNGTDPGNATSGAGRRGDDGGCVHVPDGERHGQRSRP